MSICSPWLRDFLVMILLCDDNSVDQKVRILLLLLISTNVVADKDAPNRCHLRYLATLKKLDELHTYEWGGL